MKSRLIWILLSVVLAILLLYLFLPKNAGPFRAIPAQTSLLLECNGLLRTKVLTDKTPDAHWREVLDSPLFTRCFEDVEAAIGLFKHDADLLRAFAQNKALVAFSLNQADSLHGLFALELDKDLNLENALKTNKLTPKYFPHTFHSNDIYNVHLSKTERLEVAVSGRILLFSRRATLIEDAIAQLENASNWWADRPYISELPDATLRLQVRPSALAAQWRNRMNPRWRDLPDLLARNVAWLGLAWDGETLTTYAETNGFLRNLSSWGKAPDASIFNVLPDNTAFLARVGLGNIPDFFRQIGDGRSSDFEQYVLPWVGNEAALLITEPLSPGLTGDRLLLLAVRDSAAAVQKLQAFGKARGMLPAATNAYQMFDVLGFQSSSLLKPVLGDDPAFRNPVCALAGGYAVFAPDRSSLEVFLDKYLVNQTLASNTDFLQLQQKRTQKGEASILLNAAYLKALLQNLSEFKVEASWTKSGFIGVELQPRFGRKTEIYLAAQPLSQAIPQTDIVWKAVFAKPVFTQPYLVEQPEGKTFALIQDIENNLHCLDAQNGAEIWSRALPGRILSKLVGVDFYGSGARCYAFSTANQFYILDEKGQDVEGFPFKLLATASNGATVVDFDRNSHFNYFVACDNGKIYGFGYQGKPLDGWNGLSVPAASSGAEHASKKSLVKQPILHFQHKGKDYLAVLTETGLLSVFGRDGALRFNPVQLGEANAEQFISPMEVDATSATPQIYCASVSGKVFSCNLLGKVSAQSLGKPGTALAFGQLSGDLQYEWAAFSDKTLTTGNRGQAVSNIRSQPDFPDKKPLLFFPEANKMGLVDPWSRRIWLLDPKGKTWPGFPLGGNTVFELGRINGVDMLVVGNLNGVWAYRLR